MKHRQSNIESRQQQADQKRAIAEHTNTGSGNIVPAQVLRAFHQAFQIHRGQISQRQAIHQQSHPTVQQSKAEGIRPFGVLQQRECSSPGPGDVFLHRTGREKAIHINGIQAGFHPLHQFRSSDAVNPGNRHVGQAAAPHLCLVQTQCRSTQVTADQAGIGADGFHQAVLGPFDSIFHLRRRRAPLLSGFNLKSDCPGARKQHHAKTIDQLQGHVIQILAGLRHTVVYTAPKGIFIKLLHTLTHKMLGKGFEHIFRGISPGGQSVDGIGI